MKISINLFSFQPFNKTLFKLLSRIDNRYKKKRAVVLLNLYVFNKKKEKLYHLQYLNRTKKNKLKC